MKKLAACCLLAVGALATEASAHGGTFRDGGGVPPGLRVPPGIPCDCARPDCRKCSDARLHDGDRLTRREITQETMRHWHDVAQVRIRVTFRGEAERPVEGYAMLAPSPLFAVTAGSILQRGLTLTAALAPSRDARRRYLWARRNGLDPLLVMRRNPGRYHLRAFPVRAEADTVVTIDGYGLAPPAERGPPRVYRTGSRWLIVRDLETGSPPRVDEWIDEEGGRALVFLDEATVRLRCGTHADRAREVPFVAALETARTGAGATAVGDRRVLCALEPGAALPPRVGPPPPSSRQPALPPDPQPPPPAAEP